jgi:hypothetical protein
MNRRHPRKAISEARTVNTAALGGKSLIIMIPLPLILITARQNTHTVHKVQKKCKDARQHCL